MTYEYQNDDELEVSTNKVMAWGAGLLFAMALLFPLYRYAEPSNRDSAREANLASLAEQGERLWGTSCSACHGLGGEGGIGPALRSKQFLQSATDQQIGQFIAVGVPGTAMSAFSQDYAGPLTSEEIRAITIYLRSLEPEAPDRPDWRSMIDQQPTE